ncbi:carbon-nitrogen family hydrolase [Paenibacillus chitinolyticus]|uniref:Carbon-nitrogen family hydrolase n=1 Tax=Paenibacillus chitinolyticus TaxID=79263 RepID=A0A410WVD0_9BACL|nr:carbon-nitrogen family hydrolase [Paenibacillus chitinolyticus]MCY9589308.1 carbon-nitrogen family hydrolase [Paenibacillus chitinolyticus]MCY9594381.1 carbon-nitrogen family hydrolase [Paenibacillus chitinolyticus]QAV18369.1 carbon-nitrogen family hydrolase [Paenibacillus chitinolyticus]
MDNQQSFPNRVRLALIQMDITIGEPEINRRKVEQLLLEAVGGAQKPDIIVLPEMWNTGYALDRIHELADPEGRITRDMLGSFAKEHGVHIIGGSVAEKKGEEVKNTVYGFNRNGEEILEYSKIHLFQLMDEHLSLAAGSQRGSFDLDGIPAAAVICYDIRFPELTRKLALDGAQMLFVPAEWPHPRLHHWRTLLMARAIENQMIVVSCNRVGESKGTSFFGHSMVIDPWGQVLAEGGEEEEIIFAEVDLAEVASVRGKIPVFADRRPAVYE